MSSSDVLQLLLHGNKLKQTARSGWVQRGVANAEDVAAHSYGVTFTAMVLVQMIAKPLDLEKVLSMAILHDLPEGLTTDIPSPAWRFLPNVTKSDVERRAVVEILGGVPFAPRLMGYWEELNRKGTEEALLVHDADKLDMYLQAMVYEQQTRNRQLAEFWEAPYKFHFAEAQQVFDELLMLRMIE
ncbi:MAG: HD domain-containing protein [Chloroflexi bacterium]|jgi:putative hydrolase of HD superfamily|nr:HD domain-containing protein [Chloroflexota bacterium]